MHSYIEDIKAFATVIDPTKVILSALWYGAVTSCQSLSLKALAYGTILRCYK